MNESPGPPTAALPPIWILTFGSLGDVLPLAALGGELARRGHAVSLWCGALHLPMVARLGVRALPLHTDALPPMRVQASPVLKTPQMWRRVEQGMVAGHAAVAQALAALPAHSPRPVLVASTFALAGRLAQETLGLKLATVHLSPLCMVSFQDMPPVGDLAMPRWLPRRLRPWVGRTLERLLFDPVTARSLNAWRAGQGLAPVRHVLSRWMHSPDRVLGLFPDWFGDPQPDWPAAARVLGFPLADGAGTDGLGAGELPLAQLDPALAQFLADGPPPVVCYPGSAKRDTRAYFDEALRTCQQLGQRALLLTRYREHINGGAELPAWALHRAYVPLGQVLPQAAALVHCGGVGTLAQALAAGCPQLLLPYTFDHFDNARRLRRLHLAEVHRGAGWQAALGRLLADGSVRQACAAQRLRLPPGAQVLAAAADAVQALG
jgi:UDP:flavonoid glycosyltransferase YjiC (YdhE family)